LKNWDAVISKDTKINERFDLQLRTEFFNIWNTPMYGKVSARSVRGRAKFADDRGYRLHISGRAVSKETLQDGGGRVIRWHLRLRF
jgi:hypothetical protein